MLLTKLRHHEENFDYTWTLTLDEITSESPQINKSLITHELWPPWIKLTAQYGSILFKKSNQWITNYLNKRYVSCKKFTGQRTCCMLLLTLKHFILFKRSKISKINFSVNKEIMVNMVSIINTILIHFISVRKNVLIFLKTNFLVIGFFKL